MFSQELCLGYRILAQRTVLLICDFEQKCALEKPLAERGSDPVLMPLGDVKSPDLLQVLSFNQSGPLPAQVTQSRVHIRVWCSGLLRNAPFRRAAA
jgi:hypothetical protein